MLYSRLKLGKLLKLANQTLEFLCPRQLIRDLANLANRVITQNEYLAGFSIYNFPTKSISGLGKPGDCLSIAGWGGRGLFASVCCMFSRGPCCTPGFRNCSSNHCHSFNTPRVDGVERVLNNRGGWHTGVLESQLKSPIKM